MMDHEGIMQYLSRQQTNYDQLESTAIITALNHNEYHEREVKKDELFFKEIELHLLVLFAERVSSNRIRL